MKQWRTVLAITCLWYRCAKRHFSFDRQKKSNQKKTLGYVLILLWLCLKFGLWSPDQP